MQLAGAALAEDAVVRMPVTLSLCHVAVHDPELAFGFYRDALGSKLSSDIRLAQA